MRIAAAAGHTWLVDIAEDGNDVAVEILDAKGQVLVRTDHPERRTGTQRVLLAAPATPLAVRVIGQEQSTGSALIQSYALDAAQIPPGCLRVFKSLAGADMDFAAAKEISSGRVKQPSNSARELYQRSAEGYLTAVRALNDPADRNLRGQTELALAGIQYYGLQDWQQTVAWALASSKTLAEADPYRRARADALFAAALIEIGNSASGHPVPGFDQPAPQLLAQARSILTSLTRFHMRRGERYDAGLQLNNIALTYLYGGNYAACAATEAKAGRLFGQLHEVQREAQSSQNRALCLWGLGQLPKALALLEGALPVLSADSIPIGHVTTLNNTALAHFALGHFDESLRLFDQALSLAQQSQLVRGEGQALYGIGINYYALGDRERALQFLERSRKERNEAGDGRGRMQTLRALATVYAEQQRVNDALDADREALSLAVAPAASARIRIQTASHTAAAGERSEAMTQLDALLANGATPDKLIRAEALLRRGVLLREMEHYSEALRDVAAARPTLRSLGNVMEQFEADLELARDRRALREPRAALVAVDRALSLAEAVRQQSANPEFRAQLQAPLRPAYDLKLDILRTQYDAAVARGKTEEAHRLAMTAFTTADSSRAQSLADIAAQRYPPAVRVALEREFRQREALYRELAGRRFALDGRLDSSGSDDPRAQRLMQDIAELERQVDTVNAVIAARTVPHEVQSHDPERPGIGALPDDTVLVSYWLGSEFAYAWMLSASGIEWTRLAEPAAITARSTALYHSLTHLVDTPPERRLQDARALDELVIAPLEPWIAARRQWIMVPDGALDYVPFAALRGPGAGADAFVVMHHDIAVTPAFWMLETKPAYPTGSAAHRMLLVADPVYQANDLRLAAPGKAQPGHPQRDGVYARLPYTAVEARDIAAQFPVGQVDQLIGLDATRERLLAIDWSRYRYIHIATHGIVDAEVPQLSALILGSYNARAELVDGAVRVSDLALQTLNADVVAFSACDTALGKQTPSGGLLGLGTTTLARGARAVLASQWPVADEMGARLMTDFYRYLLRDDLNAPAALGAAMRSVVAHERAADPALWAAFQVSVATLESRRPIRNAGTAQLEPSKRSQEQP